jgi:hypothetical protein
MAEAARHPITIDDDEGRRLHATWSRSGKRLIITVTTSQAHAQLEMTPEQVEALAAFLSESTSG